MSSTISAVRTIEPRLLTTLELLVIRQPAFSTEDAGTIGARELSAERS